MILEQTSSVSSISYDPATQAMPSKQKQTNSPGTGIQLAIGAASLFLFIVGLKRTFRVEDANGNLASLDASKAVAEEGKSEPHGMS